MRPVLKIAAEGIVDIAVLRRLARESDFSPGDEYNAGGKRRLDGRLNGYNAAARREPWLVLRDLDQDALCPGALASRLLPIASRHMRFRVVVREIEAWMLSDAESFVRQFAIKPTRMPLQPESLERPKNEMLKILSTSKSRVIRRAMVRSTRGLLEIGPEYNSLLSEYVNRVWRPRAAANLAKSLASTLLRLEELRRSL